MPSAAHKRGSPKAQAAILGGFILIAWVLEGVDVLLLHGRLDALGIHPRSLAGLKGIVLAPILHGGFRHLAANTFPFLVLGWLVMTRGIRTFFEATAVIVVVAGLGVWLLGRSDSVHIGASGLVFGYLGFLLLRGVFERSLLAIILAVITGVLYGGLIFGVLPGQCGISWEGHLFGFLGGVLAARLLARKKPITDEP